MTVLGIDPGFDRVGWGILETTQTQKVVTTAFGCIQTKKTNSLSERYTQIISELSDVVQMMKPEQVSIEQIFFSKNQKTAIRVSEARGVILATLLPFKLPLTEYTPNQIKLAVTGYGNADKQAVEKMIRLQLSLPPEKVIDDTIDALAIALTHTIMKFKSI